MDYTRTIGNDSSDFNFYLFDRINLDKVWGVKMRNRGLVKRAIDNMERDYNLDKIKEANKWLKFAIRSELIYNKLWKENERTVETLLLEKATQYEKQGKKKIANKWLSIAEDLDKVYEEVEKEQEIKEI